MLCATPSSNEIFAALRQMNPHKAPRPDGITYLLFTSCWGIVGPDVVDLVQSFFCFLFFYL